MDNAVWTQLETYHDQIKNRTILSLFDGDDDRFEKFSITACEMVFDYSKTNIDARSLELLHKLVISSNVLERRDAMFSGERINETEQRSVLHTALRNLNGDAVFVDDQDVMPGVKSTLAALEIFANQVRDGSLKGSTGKAFTDVVNIGIGGSDLGPAMAAQAMVPYHDGPRVHFVSNIDGADIADCMAQLNPETTMVIIASKSFGTIETMTNARTICDWLRAKLDTKDISDHLVALSTAPDRTAEFGVKDARVFGFESWVGGRYSIWGPIGLSLMLAIGPDNFREFLAGAEAMDVHFKTAPIGRNIPIALAQIGVWHRNICQYGSRAVLPYEQRLASLPAYIQQMDMESNGKGVSMSGDKLKRDSGPVVWGTPGTNGQHAYFQLIHQGTQPIPCEFMIAQNSHEDELSHQHRMLQANCLAQSEALMLGRGIDVTRELMAKQGFKGDELERQAQHRVFEGSRPSTTLIYPKLTPRILGTIIAMYEHRVFVEGVIWDVNSFDQWGVELGKILATQMQGLIEGTDSASTKDGSTKGLISAINGSLG